jgi:hypothetical protein
MKPYTFSGQAREPGRRKEEKAPFLFPQRGKGCGTDSSTGLTNEKGFMKEMQSEKL